MPYRRHRSRPSRHKEKEIMTGLNRALPRSPHRLKWRTPRAPFASAEPETLRAPPHGLRHVAIIMDGNGPLGGSSAGLPRALGPRWTPRRGAPAAPVAQAGDHRHRRPHAIYSFSSENWSRPASGGPPT
jgi:hypothetical protein